MKAAHLGCEFAISVAHKSTDERSAGDICGCGVVCKVSVDGRVFCGVIQTLV